jgi:hypothetical protein
MSIRRTCIGTDQVVEEPSPIASPTPRGDLSGSLATRFISLRALFPPPRATTFA